MSRVRFDFRVGNVRQDMATYRVTDTGGDTATIHYGLAPKMDSAHLILEVSTALPVEDIKEHLLAIIAEMEENGVYNENRLASERAAIGRALGLAGDLRLVDDRQKGSNA